VKLKDLIYEQIVTEVAGEVLFSHRGTSVIDTNHSTSRFLERLPIKLDMTTFFANMIDRVLKIEQNRPNIPEEMMIYSKSMDQAVIVAYRYDRFDRKDNTKHFYIITYLPPHQKNMKPGTFPVLIEHNQTWLSVSPELVTYLSKIVNSRRVKLTESTKNIDYFPVSLVNGLDHKIILSNNQLYDLSLSVVEIK
jgi:hypothetical protein